jgi:ElaB/YqjD/DUF883 family membrane-anchored ribosome-binding protein
MSSRGDDARGERSIDEIRRDIERRRDSITRTVDQMGRKVHDTFSWREQVADHPYVALGVAAGAGFLLAKLLLRRRSSPERLAEELGSTLRHSIHGASAPRQSGIIGGLAGIATAAESRAALELVRGRMWRDGDRRAFQEDTEAEYPSRPRRPAGPPYDDPSSGPAGTSGAEP